jgi:hypothetical protein
MVKLKSGADENKQQSITAETQNYKRIHVSIDRGLRSCTGSDCNAAGLKQVPRFVRTDK